ncbi:MAG: hypothetical protein JXK93_02985 [Sphaerochaetaceae bacterium]|nr:hypothetical protein [Sphaerochaetaceae bacterium]
MTDVPGDRPSTDVPKGDVIQILLFLAIAVSITLLFFNLLLSPNRGRDHAEYRLAENGVLDLTGWNFEDHGPVPLNGEWEFYPNQLLGVHDQFSDTQFTHVPGRWSMVDTMNNQGFATYRLRVRTDSHETLFALRNFTVSTAFRLFINGQPVVSAGRVSEDEQEAESEFHTLLTPLPSLMGEREYEIVLQVSNWDYRTGGPWRQFWFGPYENLHRWVWSAHAKNIMLLAALSMMGLFFLGLFLLRKRDTHYLFLSLLSILLALRPLFSINYLITYILPGIPFDLMIRIEYLALFLAVQSAAFYFSSIYRDLFCSVQLKFMSIVTSLFILLVVLFPPVVFTHSIYLYYVFSLYVYVYLIGVIVRAYRLRITGSSLMLLGGLIFIVTILNDYLFFTFSWKTESFVEVGMLFFIFIQAFALSQRLTVAFHQVQDLSENLSDLNQHLEEEVEKRAEELKSVYDSMKNLEWIRVAEEERKRVGRDLHDSLGQSVHALELLGASLGQVETLPQDVKRKIDTIFELNKDIKKNLYTILGELYPVGIGSRGLLAAVEQYAADMMALHDLSIDVVCPVRDIMVDAVLADDVYHIVREGVLNAIRHSSVGWIEVAILLQEYRLTVRVINDGVKDENGEPPAAPVIGGHGTSIMTYRAESHGGSFSYGYSGKNNYTIEAILPIPGRTRKEV